MAVVNEIGKKVSAVIRCQSELLTVNGLSYRLNDATYSSVCLFMYSLSIHSSFFFFVSDITVKKVSFFVIYWVANFVFLFYFSF